MSHLLSSLVSCAVSSYAYAELSVGHGGGNTTIGSMDDEDEFGEIEMGQTTAQAPISVDNAKFTVEEDEEEEAMRTQQGKQ